MMSRDWKEILSMAGNWLCFCEFVSLDVKDKVYFPAKTKQNPDKKNVLCSTTTRALSLFAGLKGAQ